MTPDEAAWVRAHVWTARMRKTDREVPGYYGRCACQWGPCGWCEAGEHEKCRNAGTREVEASYIVTREDVPAVIRREAGGPVHARVWEVGHRHVWVCPCAGEHVTPDPNLLDLLADLG